jgi:hypothetical protein
MHLLSHSERATARASADTMIERHAVLTEHARAEGVYAASCWAPPPHLLAEYIGLRDHVARLEADRSIVVPAALLARLRRDLRRMPLELRWIDTVHNLVTTEGKNAALTHLLKGSSYTASNVIGLIEDTGYSSVAAGNTAANITANGGGSPANGWNEAPSGTAAARGTPSYGTASGGSLATSSSVSFSMLATDTIKGAFQLIRSGGGTAPTTTVGNTSGALYSAGLFTGGDRSVSNGDTLNVSYTASL